MSDLAEVIARVRRYIKAAHPGSVVPVPQATMTKLLDAAEAAERARDAALEEAARKIRSMQTYHNWHLFSEVVENMRRTA